MVSNFLSPAQPVTPLLALAASLTGTLIGGLMAWFCPRKSTNAERLGKTFGFGGAWGVAVCLLTLVSVAKLDRTLPPLELAGVVVLAFLIGGISGAVTQRIVAGILSKARGTRSPQLPEFPVLPGKPHRPRRMPEDLGIPAISTRRR